MVRACAWDVDYTQNPSNTLTRHVADPAGLYVPAGHMDAVALVDPAAQAKPGAHAPVQLADVRPVVLPNRPAPHALQRPAPPGEKVPAAQMSDVDVVDPAGHAYPGAHAPVQLEDTRPLLLPKRPAGHSPEHVDVFRPAAAPKVPLGHRLQAAAPARLNLPTGHTNAVALVDPKGHAYPALQAPEHAAVPRPLLLPNRPGAHAVQDAAPARLYVPGVHTPGHPVDRLAAAVALPKVPGAHWVQLSLPYRAL